MTQYSNRAAFDAHLSTLPEGPDQSAALATLAKRTNPAFVAGMLAFMATISKRHADSHFSRGFSATFVDHLQLEVGNTGGFVRIVEQGRDSEGRVNGQRMSHSFVSMADAPATKTMAARKAGEIFKCATYKAPAKHGRGSIFSDSCGGESLSPEGRVAYLR